MKRIARIIIWTRRFGILNLLLRFRNKRILWKIEKIEQYKPGGTSITDSEYLSAYTTLCGLAAHDDSIFKRFRSCEVLVEALDHVSLEQGQQYLCEIQKMATWSREFSKALTQLDAVGNPRKYRFANYGTISPTLLRYLKVYLDLKRLFGPMDGKRISEIGIGFGGQAGLITILDQPAQYSLFDIPPVLELTQKYLRSIEVNGNFEALDGRVPKIIETDLVISNYAFSELNRKIQEEYLKNVILRSKMGYITWNNLSQTQLGGYSLAELIRRIPDSEVIPETPLTAVSNVILMWNRTKN
jgi:hypothetical protein